MKALRLRRTATLVLPALLAASALAEGATHDSMLVNTTTDGNQQDPDVAMSADGTSLILWTELSTVVSTIKGRLYDATGTAASGEFPVSPTDGSYRVSPHVCARDSGGWVTVWTEFPPYTGIGHVYAQILSADGAASGDRVLLTTGNTDAGVLDADVGCLPGGGFVAAWTTHEGFNGSDIVGRRYAADGTPSSERFLVNETHNWIPSDAAVEAAADGRFLVVWSAGCPFYWTDCPTGPDGSDAATVARLYAADGAPTGGQFIVNTFTDASQGATGFAAAFGDDGGFTIAFTNGDFDWAEAMAVCGHMPCGLLRARTFAANGTALGDDFPVSDSEPGDHLHPTVTADGTGGYLYAWELEQDVVYARDFDAVNAPASDPFVLIEYDDYSGYSRIPRLASVAGKFHATWLTARSNRDVAHLFFPSLPTDPGGPVDPPEPPPFTCPEVPSENCTLANAGGMRVRAGSSSASMRWKWQDETGDSAAVDAMLHGVTVCMYRNGELVDHGNVPSKDSESGAALWRSRTNRWTFQQPADAGFTVRKLRVARRAESSKFALDAETPDVSLLRSASPILVQLYKADGTCFQPPGL